MTGIIILKKNIHQDQGSIRISKKVSDPNPDPLRLGLHRRPEGESLSANLHQPVEKVALAGAVIADDADNRHRSTNYNMACPLMTSLFFCGAVAIC